MRSGTVLLASIVLLSSFQSFAQTLSQQEQCAQQAARLYHQLGWDHWRMETKSDTRDVDYSTHYDVKLDRCFMLLHTDDVVTNRDKSQQEFVSYDLIDAYENRDYAQYSSNITFSSNVNASNAVTPHINECRLSNGPPLSPLLHDEHTCNSEEEFNKFVVRYMQ